MVGTNKRPLKIVLLSPKGPLYRHRQGIFKKSLRYAPLTLITLAALIPPEIESEVEIIDEGIDEIPNVLTADIIGITIITGTASRSYELADHFRKQNITVVLGGPHVSLMPEEASEHADAIVTGYAEQSWPQFLKDFCHGKVKSCYQQAEDFNLDLPVFPTRELLPDKKYLTKAVFEATRSCIHNCEFCVAPTIWGRKPFFKPVANVVEDIKRQTAKKILFIDLNLISSPEYAMALFEALIPLKLQWYGLSTIFIVKNSQLLTLAMRSGCRGLLIGFESISKGNLISSNKGFNHPQQYIQAINLLHQHNISVMGCFVFGLDDDTVDSFRDTAEFVIDAGVDLPRFAIATPFPGTPFYKRLSDQGRILTTDWQLYDGQHVVFQPKKMSVYDLQKGHETAWKHAYQFRSIIKRMNGLRSLSLHYIAANLGYRFYANNLHRYYNCDRFM